MQAAFHFDLNNHEDKYLFEAMQQGVSLYECVTELKRELRNIIKYQPEGRYTFQSKKAETPADLALLISEWISENTDIEN